MSSPIMYQWCGIVVVVLNIFWLIGEVCLTGMAIHEIYLWKLKLDTQERYDSSYISDIAFVFSCIIISVVILAIISELIANSFLYGGLRRKQNPKLKVYIWITAVVTFLSTVGCVFFNTYDGYYLYRDSIKYKLIVLSFWISKIVYNVLSVCFIARLFHYINYYQAAPVAGY